MNTTRLLYTGFVEGKPVSVNHAYRRGQQGRVYLTDAATAWRMLVFGTLRLDWARDVFKQPLNLPLEISLTFYGVRGDADNLVKITLDGVRDAIGIDDQHFSPVISHVVRAAEARAMGKPQGVTICIYEPTSTPAPAPDPGPSDVPELAQLGFYEADPPHAPGSLRARDLLDDAVIERLLPPVTQVRVYPAFSYGGIAVLFPPSPLNADDGEWGTFLPLAQARELRDALDGVLASAAPAGTATSATVRG